MTTIRLFAILIAFSLLFAPFAMRGGEAIATAPASHHAQGPAPDHCQPPADENTEGAVEKPCCAALCAGATLATVAAASEAQFVRLPPTAAAAGWRSGVLSEIATPPPRLA